MCEMTADEFFAKRDRMASAFKIPADQIPAEAVWFISEEKLPITKEDAAWAKQTERKVLNESNS